MAAATPVFAAAVAAGAAWAWGRRSAGTNRDVLVVGGGGREHAITWRIAQSPELGPDDTIYVAPGNGGTALMEGQTRCHVRNVAIRGTDVHRLVQFAREKRVRLVVVGPEAPLEAGLADALAEQGIPCFGPSKLAAELECSKAYCKDFMHRYRIPTAKYRVFTDADAAERYLRSAECPKRVVVKASGLAAGKGVLLPTTTEEAVGAARGMLQRRMFGEAGQTVVIEEFLEGVEASVLAFSDGSTVVPMPAAQDHKRVFEFDEGPNTGGMGAFAPSPTLSEADIELVRRTILQPAIDGLRHEGRPFVGVLFAGLMLGPRNWSTSERSMHVLEFNVRFGDPETQAILPLLRPECDLLRIFEACAQGRLCDVEIAWTSGLTATTVVAISQGYPGPYAKEVPITLPAGPNDLAVGVGGNPGTLLFHAGTCLENREEHARLLTSGGRVLAVTGLGPSKEDAALSAYRALEHVSFAGLSFRRDIGGQYFRPRAQEPIRVAVLGSTRGTDLEAIFEAIEGRDPRGGEPLAARVEVVVSNKESAGILDKARARGVPAVHIPTRGRSREESDREIIAELDARNVDLVLLIGYMRIVSSVLVQRYRWRLLNVHPSLLPEFGGGMDLDVHSQVLGARKTESGCTIHFVTEDVDGGPILIQRRCAVDPDHDTAETLKTRVQQLEGEAFVDAIRLYEDHRGFLSSILQHGGFPSPQASLLVAELERRRGVDVESVAAAGAGQRPGGGLLSYAGAGVDVSAGQRFVRAIAPLARSTRRPGADASLGGFGGLFDLKSLDYEDPVLVSGTDGVGTKLLVAQSVGEHRTVGVDLVAMCVNDILSQGAEPLFFLDYFATGHLNAEVAAAVVAGIANGCRKSHCALIGGETAEMPGMYGEDHYDLAGFAVGAAERDALLPKVEQMRAGDVLLGLASSGVHSNGFSLVRHVLESSGYSWDDPPPFPSRHRTLGRAVLEPTRIYVASLLPMLRSAASRRGEGAIKGVAHITGGGFPENVPRILSSALRARLDARSWDIPPVFGWLHTPGTRQFRRDASMRVSADEMLNTFNLGIGMVLVVGAEQAELVSSDLRSRGEMVWTIGHLEPRQEGSPAVAVDGLEAALSAASSAAIAGSRA